MPNEKRIKNILIKYQIDSELCEYTVWKNILNIQDPLTEDEHNLLFDFFWDLGNKRRKTNVSISEGLKRKIIQNRHNISRYDMALIGHFEGSNIPDIIKKCHLNEVEESEVWAIFHKLWHHDSARDSDEINSLLGTYKIVEHKLKWFGKINVLDIGCGKNGNGISTLTARYNGKIRGYGIDLDIGKHPSNVDLRKANVENLPFENNFFDVIYSSNVIYYFDEDRLVQVIQEILRTLKPKGMFVFDDKRRLDYYENKIIPNTFIRAKVLKNGNSLLIVKY